MQRTIEIEIRVGQGGLCALYKNAVHIFFVQQTLEDPPLAGDLVAGSVEHRGAVVGGENGFGFPENAGEDVLSDISCDDRYGATGGGCIFCGAKNTGTATLTAGDQAIIHKTLKCLTHCLAAGVEGLMELLLGGEQGTGGIDLFFDLAAERIGDHFVFWGHSSTSHKFVCVIIVHFRRFVWEKQDKKIVV